PRMTSPTSAGFTAARRIASRTTTAPRSTALRSLKTPPKEPMGVRQVLRMTASVSSDKDPHLGADDEVGAGCMLHGLDGRVGGNLTQHQAGGRDVNYRKLGDDHVHDL